MLHIETKIAPYLISKSPRVYDYGACGIIDEAMSDYQYPWNSSEIDYIKTDKEIEGVYTLATLSPDGSKINIEHYFYRKDLSSIG